MKIGEYEQMMSYMTRQSFDGGGSSTSKPTLEDLKKSGQVKTATDYKPKNPKIIQLFRDFEERNPRTNKSDGGPLVPKPKPEGRTFQEKLTTLKKAAQGLTPESRLQLFDYYITEAVKKGELSKEQASGIMDSLDAGKVKQSLETFERENFAKGSSRLNETKLEEPYLFEYDTPSGDKRYQAKVMGSGFSKGMRKAFPYTEEGKQQALEAIKDHIAKYKAPEGIKKLKNPPNSDKPWRYKTYDKGAQYFATKEEAEAFKKSRLEGRTIKQTKLPTEDFSKIVDRIKQGETLEAIAKDYDLADASRIRLLLKNKGVTYSQLTPNPSSYTQDPDLRTSFIENYKKKSSVNLAKELFPEDKLSTALSKYATLRDTLKKEKVIKVQPGYTDELKETFSKEPKAVQAKKVRARRDKLIKDVSDLDIERLLKEGKTGEGLDQAHRLSLKQVKKTGQLYNVLNLGIEAPDINREVIQSYEDSLTKLYNKQNKLVKEAKKFDKVPKDISLQLSDLNKQVSDIVAKTDGRLQGVHIDEFTLKPKTTGINYIKTLGMGLIDKDVKKLTQADIDLAKAIMPYQIESERRLAPGAKADLLKNQRGFATLEMLGSDKLANAAKLYGPQAARLANMSLAGGLISGGAEMLMLDASQKAGLSPQEIALNIATGGFGTQFKDLQERADFVRQQGFGNALDSALRKQQISQNVRPAPGLPSAFGAPQELTPSEQEALRIFNVDAMKPIDERRALQAAEYERQAQTDFSDPMFRETFSDGSGPKDPSKRKFIKVMGGLASIPVLGKFFKIAEPLAPVASKAVESFKGAPEWFGTLVNKVIQKGTDMTKSLGFKDRQEVYGTKIADDEMVIVYKDLDDGSIRVEYQSPGNMGQDSVDLTYKPAQSTEDGFMPAEFKAVEAEPRNIRSGPDDYDIEFDGENVVESVDDLMSDTSRLEEFATGKPLDSNKVKIASEKRDRVEALNNDTVEQAEYLETKYGPGDYDDYD